MANNIIFRNLLQSAMAAESNEGDHNGSPLQMFSNYGNTILQTLIDPASTEARKLFKKVIVELL